METLEQHAPPVEELRAAAVDIASAVASAAVSAGVAPPAGDDELRERVVASQWTPRYVGGRNTASAA